MTESRHRPGLTTIVVRVLVAVLFIAWVTELAAPPAQASNVVNVTFHVPAQVNTNPCSPRDGEINLNGDIHIVITTIANGHDGYRVKHHLNSHMRGTSILTGTRYVSNETSNAQWYAPPPFPVVRHQTYHFVLVSQGPTPNYVLHMTMRETVNAGTVTDASADGWSMDCQS